MKTLVPDLFFSVMLQSVPINFFTDYFRATAYLLISWLILSVYLFCWLPGAITIRELFRRTFQKNTHKLQSNLKCL